jgi:hypothetical protein
MTTSRTARSLKVSVVAMLALAGVGCTHMANYNPAYIPPVATSTPAEKSEGRALVFTEKKDDDYSYVGHPTSFTGGGTSLQIALGVITREIAVSVFGKNFSDGAEQSGTLDRSQGYRVIVQPKVTNFSFEYNAAKNAGFAITPTVTLTLDVGIMGPDGKSRWQHQYPSGPVESESYMMTGNPGDEVGKAAHKAIGQLMLQAAGDVREYLRANGTPSGTSSQGRAL